MEKYEGGKRMHAGGRQMYEKVWECMGGGGGE